MILLTIPRYMKRIWGSLSAEGDTEPVGEIWWLFDDESGSTELLSPAGSTVSTLAELVRGGSDDDHSRFPVMVKTLHTARRLSLQVHPGAHGEALFKEETWIVLSSSGDGWMMGGLRNRDPEAFARSIDSGRAEELLCRMELREGDVYHIPPGTVHALGPGLSILEIQTNCDVTYRLFDWGRTDVDGKPRQLHIQEGMKAIDWDSGGKPLVAGRAGGIDPQALQNCGYRVSRIRGSREVDLGENSVIFLDTGTAVVGETEIEAPACMIADAGGGEVWLKGGGYRIETGGS